jgi:hypothetical protein
MFKTPFTDYLEELGWVQTGPMCFTHKDSRIDFLFDSSHSLVVYFDKKVVRSVYLKDMDELKALLHELL